MFPARTPQHTDGATDDRHPFVSDARADIFVFVALSSLRVSSALIENTNALSSRHNCVDSSEG